MNATVSDGLKRKDAARHRSAILDAARGLFAESAEVPMCEVARRAGVGQATLNRNFPDRQALAAGLLDEHVRHLELLAGESVADRDAVGAASRVLTLALEGLVPPTAPH